MDGQDPLCLVFHRVDVSRGRSTIVHDILYVIVTSFRSWWHVTWHGGHEVSRKFPGRFTENSSAVMIPGFFGNSKVSHGIVRPGTAFLNFATNVTTRVRKRQSDTCQIISIKICQNLTDTRPRVPWTNWVLCRTLKEQTALWMEFWHKLHPYKTPVEPSIPRWNFAEISYAVENSEKFQIGKADQYRQPIFIVLLVLAPLFYGIGILGGVLNKWKLIFTWAIILWYHDMMSWPI